MRAVVSSSPQTARPRATMTNGAAFYWMLVLAALAGVAIWMLNHFDR